MKYVKVGTPYELCDRCGTPVVMKRGAALYCHGAVFEVRTEGAGRKAQYFTVQEAITHNCNCDRAHYQGICNERERAKYQR